ncbi:hypothetical protein BT96DRAFT_1007042 [Gymnopus androsaceus JB14]|uniref:HTH psq-type domain-containing protein n=1 Tax=Gymnopus androsaceus JB14 TaxID=1447944 RepID=A0A6A4GJ95_9AGAR|nr:hypothetical protein BT96DRAFT_1007042 [Gymnopus androsaceus JB14]
MAHTQHASPKLKNRFIGILQAGKPMPDAAKIADIPFGTARKIWNWSEECETATKLLSKTLEMA